MLMINNIKNYLYDKRYYINIYDEYIHLFNYKELNKFKEDEIIIYMSDFKLIIRGKDFLVIKMLKDELLIKGIISTLEKKYEE